MDPALQSYRVKGTPISGFTQSQSLYYGRILADTGFYQGPGPEYPVIATLKAETIICIVSDRTENGYIKVSNIIEEKEGYIDRSMVSIEAISNEEIDWICLTSFTHWVNGFCT
jgi:hypothetical protein